MQGNFKQKILTLVLIVDSAKDSLLLGMKKRGFGVGKWDGFGGKVDPKETVYQGALRELKEEAGITCTDLDFRGLITFEFKGVPEYLQVHIFKGSKYIDDITESEEMRPQWYKIDQIPYSAMWKDETFWFPLLLKDESVYGYFLLDGDEIILENRLKSVSKEELINYQKETTGFPLL